MSGLIILLIPAAIAVPAVLAGQKDLPFREYLKVAVTLSLLFIVVRVPVAADSLTAWFKPWFAVSLGFAAAADFLLSNQRRSWFFLAGLCGFFVAYGLYGLAFHRIAGFQLPALIALPLVAIVLLIIYRRLVNLPGSMRVPVLSYMCVLAHLLTAALAFFFSSVWKDAGILVPIFFLAGTVLILISDSIIAQKEFREPHTLDEFWILSSYYAAQISIVGGFLLL